ncbi:site-specific integrase [Dysgonomonas capnocytophagoides]|uniref:Site-specific integrase n=2 Tax=Dysgonomonas capnocytophagoides TaxID=45254 RepID=A0A4Y8LBR1_9BACT|nr:site-specific integrase [Dysgonomonas capnocytophagoides]TFD97956.1 site-specific integrase [Dysgonomonas capnocytophagoides]
MKTTYRILFLLRKNRQDKDGLSKVAVRITIGGEAVEFNTHLSVSAHLWNPIGRLNGKTKEAIKANDVLFKIRSDINVHYIAIYEKHGYVTPEKLRDAYLGIEIQRNTLLSLYGIKVEQKTNLVGKTIQSTTLAKYLATRKRISDFIKYQYNEEDLPVKDVDFQFVTDYEVYLRSVCNCGHNSCIKHLRYLKQIISIALKNRYITNDPFDDYKLGYKPVNKEFLIESEIKKLMNKKFSVKRLEEVRDVFLFQIFTGLAYIDAANLTKDNIFEDGLSQKWIRLIRQKSSVQANIPLLDVPLSILEKYSGLENGKLLPIHTNQKMNEYLKEIAALCGINKRLTTHCGRHSFSTLMLTKGVSIESVSKMLGHTNITTTQIYAKILNEKIYVEVNKVRGELDAFQEYYKQVK